MKKFVIIFVAVLMCGGAFGQENQRQRLEKHLYTLASDSLQGRGAGTDDGRRAAEYIAKQWRAMGLKGLWNDDYRMPFHHHKSPEYCNLVAVIEGSDPVLKDEYIVLGAHYDHVGVIKGEIYNGADDNASGSSCLIEVARQLLARRGELKRSVIICAFDAEEIGMRGSQDMVLQLEKRNMLERVRLMMSIDMVGWYAKNGSLMLEGVGTLKKGEHLTEPSILGVDIKVKTKAFETSAFTATDTEPFAKKGIPTLAVSTGLKSPYHKTWDDADLIDYEGLDRVTDYVVALSLVVSGQGSELSSGKVASKHRVRGSSLRLGLSLGVASSRLDFTHAAVNSKYGFGIAGGLKTKYSFSRLWALRADVIYAHSRCPYPDASDLFNSSYGMEQHTVKVPLMLLFQLGNGGSGLDCGLGAYYGRVLSGGFYDRTSTSAGPDYNANANQCGIVLNMAFRMGSHFALDISQYYQLNSLFNTSTGLPSAQKLMSVAAIDYYF